MKINANQQSKFAICVLHSFRAADLDGDRPKKPKFDAQMCALLLLSRYIHVKNSKIQHINTTTSLNTAYRGRKQKSQITQYNSAKMFVVNVMA